MKPGGKLKRRTGLRRTAWPSSGGTLPPKRAPSSSTPAHPTVSKAAKKAAKNLRQFGTERRAEWWKPLPCVCLFGLQDTSRHPKCTGGLSERSHVVSRGAGGLAHEIVPMSKGCHDAWHLGRLTYCRELAMSLADMFALAADYATRGDDPPRGETTT